MTSKINKQNISKRNFVEAPFNEPDIKIFVMYKEFNIVSSINICSLD